MEKIILFYKFVALPDPTTTMHWQRELCEKLDLSGRIIVTEQGINGTLGGPIKNVKAYITAMNTHQLFKGIQYKLSDGTARAFPPFIVKIRPDLVTLAPT